jgi:hypothetical protein
MCLPTCLLDGRAMRLRPAVGLARCGPPCPRSRIGSPLGGPPFSSGLVPRLSLQTGATARGRITLGTRQSAEESIPWVTAKPGTLSRDVSASTQWWATPRCIAHAVAASRAGCRIRPITPVEFASGELAI